MKTSQFNVIVRSVVAALLLSSTVAMAQLAQLAPEIVGTYGLNVISGNALPESLNTEKAALVFFVPNECPACDEFVAFERFATLPLQLVLVTNAPEAEAGDWADSHPGWNVWADPHDGLAMYLGVKDAPSVYMVHAGSVVNADYWPFASGLDGLYSDLLYFALSEPGPRADEVVGGLLGVDLSDTGLIGIGGNTSKGEPAGPAIVVVCWPGCGVCREGLGYLQDSYLTSAGLIPPVIVASVVDEATRGTSATAFAAWSDAGFSVQEVTRSAAGVLDLPVSPVTLIVDQEGTVTWAVVGFSSTVGEKLRKQWEEQ
ncbi:MAG: hypothetical protein WBB07_21690 [Mycobacterium sp.]